MPNPPPASAPAPDAITGLVLAGGQGSRVGGLDKGLQLLQGRALVAHALERLAPQVGALAINANRHLDRYAGFGLPVWPDADDTRPGPLAGMLAGLEACGTEWLACVPCDSPLLPTELVARLGAGLQGAPAALAATHGTDGGLQAQPVFCLLHRSLGAPLREALARGERKIDRWARTQGAVLVPFDDHRAFFNTNTLEELAAAAQLLSPAAAAAETGP
jgi:molybdenum cofactor guanylyltransferase